MIRSPEFWKPFEEACNGLLKSTFPNASALDYYGASIEILPNDDLKVTCAGETKLLRNQPVTNT